MLLKNPIFILLYVIFTGLLSIHALFPGNPLLIFAILQPYVIAAGSAVVLGFVFRLEKVHEKILQWIRYRIPVMLVSLATFLRILDMAFHRNFAFSMFHLNPLNVSALSLFAVLVFFATLNAERFSKHTSEIIFMTSLLLLHIFNIHRFSPGLFHALSGEDGVFEYLTFVLYLIGSGVFGTAVYAIIQNIRQTKTPTKSTIALLIFAIFGTIAYFGIAGEEISWGQRIIGFETPEAYKNVNTQYEFNLHNYEVIFGRIYHAYGLFAIYVLVSPVINMLFKKASKGIRFVVKLLTFRWYHAVYFIPTLAYVAFRLYYDTTVYDIWEESTEVLFGLGMVFYAVQVRGIVMRWITQEEL